jgi:VanZ family protein
MGLIFGLSAMSNPPVPPGHLSDKTAHFLEYCGLGFLLVRAVARARWTKPTLAMVASAVALAVLYAVSDEGHQYFVPGRQCDWRDAMADTAGASTAAVCVYAWGIIAAVFRRR